MDKETFQRIIYNVTKSIAGKPLNEGLAADLNKRFPPESETFVKIQKICETAIDDGWMCGQEFGGIKWTILPDIIIPKYAIINSIEFSLNNEITCPKSVFFLIFSETIFVFFNNSSYDIVLFPSIIAIFVGVFFAEISRYS